jgi:hypothetical protein
MIGLCQGRNGVLLSDRDEQFLSDQAAPMNLLSPEPPVAIWNLPERRAAGKGARHARRSGSLRASAVLEFGQARRAAERERIPAGGLRAGSASFSVPVCPSGAFLGLAARVHAICRTRLRLPPRMTQTGSKNHLFTPDFASVQRGIRGSLVL